MTEKKNFIGIIPSRYGSTRFPGKPLVDILGKSMIQRVFEQTSKAIDTVYVATDDKRIYDAVSKFGGNVVMTSENHKSGTDRCSEAVEIIEEKLGAEFNAVINIQGDEPFIEPEQLELLKSCFIEDNAEIATLIKEINSTEVLFDPNRPKVIVNNENEAIYFSRSVIPYIRGTETDSWLKKHCFYMHIGLYGFRRDILKIITQLPQSSLELAESLEQLRWIENGYKIAVRKTNFESFGIDTPEDLKKVITGNW